MDNTIKFKYFNAIFIVAVLVFAFFTIQPQPTQAASIAENVKGRILLQVQQNGEAWYVNPDTLLRHYMGRPKDAFELMRSQGLGISNEDIAKIPIGLQALSGVDTDGDGLSDIFEDSIGSDKTKTDTDSDGFNDYQEVQNGFSPTGSGELIIDNSLVNHLKGKILLQVERNGEAWYLNPVDGKRYFLGRPSDAFGIMRFLGLGITDEDLNKISLASGNNLRVSSLCSFSMEFDQEKFILKEDQAGALKSYLPSNSNYGFVDSVSRPVNDEFLVNNSQLYYECQKNYSGNLISVIDDLRDSVISRFSNASVSIISTNEMIGGQKAYLVTRSFYSPAYDNQASQQLYITVVNNIAYFFEIDGNNADESSMMKNVLETVVFNNLSSIIGDRLSEWVEGWQEAVPSFSLSVLTKQSEESIEFKSESVYDPSEPSEVLRDQFYVYSPDRTKFLDQYVDILLRDEGGVVKGYPDVDSAVNLVDLDESMSKRLLMCGPSACLFSDVVWLDNERFVVTGSGELQSNFVAILYLYDLAKNTVTRYNGPEVESSIYWQIRPWRTAKDKFPNIVF